MYFSYQAEGSNEAQYACKVHSETEIEVQNTIFELDKVFGPSCSQKVIYDDLVLPMVLDALEGYNMTLFTYGQTGSGKTYTMQGVISQNDDKGIISRTAETILSTTVATAAASTEHSYRILLSCMEIYQEKLIDLLPVDRKTESTALRIRQQSNGEVWVQGLMEKRISSIKEFQEVYISYACFTFYNLVIIF